LSESDWLRSADGTRLFVRRWPLPAPRGVLLLVHGLGEHSGRYLHVAEHFLGAGYAVLALDYRGHGRSDGPRVHVERFDAFVEDVAALRAEAARWFPGVPLFLVGHSQGGLVALRSALLAPEGLAGLVVSSPLLGVHPSARPGLAMVVAARLLDIVAPRLRLPNHVDPCHVSRDPSVVDAYRSDPLVTRRVSARWYASLQCAIADTFERAASLRVPSLIMASGSDLLVDPDAASRFAARAPSSLVTLVRWPELYHEMFNEPEREAVFRRMERWLSAPPASGAASR
jgi:alpha-beta hydrolase superfamily lysophospholipase